jgi:hypothetical protein
MRPASHLTGKVFPAKDTGARSVLILENRDLCLFNHIIILEVIELVSQGRAEARRDPGRHGRNAQFLRDYAGRNEGRVST